MTSNTSFFLPKFHEAEKILKVIANHRRLEVMHLLKEKDELCVGEMLEHIDLSQSALSQHLAKMRNEGLVSARREAQTIYYKIANENISNLINHLYKGLSFLD